jgi:hypothetical protein
MVSERALDAARTLLALIVRRGLALDISILGISLRWIRLGLLGPQIAIAQGWIGVAPAHGFSPWRRG